MGVDIAARYSGLADIELASKPHDLGKFRLAAPEVGSDPRWRHEEPGGEAVSLGFHLPGAICSTCVLEPQVRVRACKLCSLARSVTVMRIHKQHRRKGGNGLVHDALDTEPTAHLLDREFERQVGSSSCMRAASADGEPTPSSSIRLSVNPPVPAVSSESPSSRVDNGPEFITRALDRWAYENGVTPDFSRPGKKPTDNAFGESFNGRLRDECLNTHWFLSLEDARDKKAT